MKRLKFKLRAKIALLTLLLFGLFTLLTIIFSQQSGQQLIGQLNEAQALELIQSEASLFEKYLHFQYEIDRNEKNLQSETKAKNTGNRIYYERLLKQIEKQADDNFQIIGALQKQKAEKPKGNTHADFSTKEGILLYHSNSRSLSAKVNQTLLNQKFDNRLRVYLNMKDSSNAQIQHFVNSHRFFLPQERNKSFTIERALKFLTDNVKNIDYALLKTVESNDGYLNFSKPLYAYPQAALAAQKIIELWPSASFSKTPLKRNFEKRFAQFQELLGQLRELQLLWQKKNPDHDFRFNSLLKRDLNDQGQGKKLAEELAALKKQARVDWLLLREFLSNQYTTTIDELKQKRKSLEEKNESIGFIDIQWAQLESQKNELLRGFNQLSGIVGSYESLYYANNYQHSSLLRKLFSASADTFDVELSDFLSLLATPQDLSKLLLRASFGGVFSVKIYLYDVLKTHDKFTMQMADIGISFSIRVIFLVVILAGFLVKDIKSLAYSANVVRDGNLDETFRVSSKDELADLAHTFNNMLEGLREKEKLRSEIAAAEVIQKNLLPGKDSFAHNKSLDFAFEYRAMSGVGGDYIDFFEISQNQYCWLMADVSNHGVGPGLIMTMARSLIRSFASQKMPLRQMLSKVNAMLYHDTPPEIFVTLFVAYLDLEKHTMNYANCGHNPCYILRGGQNIVLNENSMALGAMMPEIFDSILNEYNFKLQKNDFIFQFTDGLTEAQAPSGEYFGELRLEKLLVRLQQLSSLTPLVLNRNIIVNLERFCGFPIAHNGPTRLADDVAISSIKIL